MGRDQPDPRVRKKKERALKKDAFRLRVRIHWGGTKT